MPAHGYETWFDFPTKPPSIINVFKARGVPCLERFYEISYRRERRKIWGGMRWSRYQFAAVYPYCSESLLWTQDFDIGFEVWPEKIPFKRCVYKSIHHTLLLIIEQGGSPSCPSLIQKVCLYTSYRCRTLSMAFKNPKAYLDMDRNSTYRVANLHQFSPGSTFHRADNFS